MVTLINFADGAFGATGPFDCTGADFLFVFYNTTNETGPGGTRLGVSFNGVAMTLAQVGGVQGMANGGNGGFDPSQLVRLYGYYLPNPASGIHNILATAGQSGHWFALAYSGIKGAVPEALVTNVQPTANTDCSFTLTPVTDNSLIVAAYQYGDTAGFVAGTNFTARESDIGDGSGTWRTTFGDYFPAPAASDTVQGKHPTLTFVYGMAISFAPVFSGGLFF